MKSDMELFIARKGLGTLLATTEGMEFIRLYIAMFGGNV